MENSVMVLIHWWTGWLDMACLDPCWVNMVYLLYGSLYPFISIKGSILEINHLLQVIGIHTGDGVLMAGYSVIAVYGSVKYGVDD
jgi:hypothetical protein